jgi:hypothetical protein
MAVVVIREAAGDCRLIETWGKITGVGYNTIKGPKKPGSYSGKLRPSEAFVHRR